MNRISVTAICLIAISNCSNHGPDLSDRLDVLLNEELKSYSCDFGESTALTFCSWWPPSIASPTVKWKLGQGALSHWSGGPMADHSLGDSTGGYAYFETSVSRKHHVTTRSLKFVPFLSAILNNVTTDLNLGEQRISGLWNRISSVKSTIVQKIRAPQQAIVMNIPSVLRDHSIPRSAELFSAKLKPTRPEGVCLQFYYTVYGLSAESFSVYLKDEKTGRRLKLWQSFFDTQDKWLEMQLSYAIPHDHRVVIEGRAKDRTEPEREYRGYIAVDDIRFLPVGYGGACYGHCTFDGGLCSWSNDHEDNFDWSLARGSDNLYTGPAQDYNSYANDYPPGNFLFIDATYPRRFGDKAVLVSPQFPVTDSERGLCMKFAYHMFGSGIGNLSVSVRTYGNGSSTQKALWRISGEQGNKWNLAQVAVSSSEPFIVQIEATVGQNSMGNIAIDSVVFQQEFSSPESATLKEGDCTFEDNICSWQNVHNVKGMDDFDWVRYPYGLKTGTHYLYVNNTINNSSDVAFYLTLNGDMLRPDKAGLSALLISPPFPGNSMQCMSFHYFMYQTMAADQKRPSLGGLKVSLKMADKDGAEQTVPLWRLTNHQSNKWRTARVPLGQLRGENRTVPTSAYQVVIEGIWANSNTGIIAIDDISFVSGGCDLIPISANTVYGECSFDKDVCGWTNYVVQFDENTDSLLTDGTVWTHIQPSTLNYGNNRLRDHTYDIPVGYMAFNVAGKGSVQKSLLMSPNFSNEGESNVTEKCVSFWFASFPGQDGTRTEKLLQIFQAILYPKQGLVSARSVLLWKISDHQVMSAEWLYGQVTFTNDVRYRLLFKAESKDGGYALDDVTFYNGPCQSQYPTYQQPKPDLSVFFLIYTARPYLAHVEKHNQNVQFL
ncbi:MAM and LDL-receptor class A domain-containing protein 2 [Halotydeus destructor]|nr:MAM and LDL-receptor class A domain-containing protein 2 [Halotydeus destructor]